jgi:hypothetical protein
VGVTTIEKNIIADHVARYRALFSGTAIFFGAALGTMLSPLSEVNTISFAKGFALISNFFSMGLLILLIEMIGELILAERGRRAAVFALFSLVMAAMNSYYFAKLAHAPPALFFVIVAAWLVTTVLIAFVAKMNWDRI